MKQKYSVIGIDPGVTTGIAQRTNGVIESVDSMHHNAAFEYVELCMVMTPKGKIFVVVEDARKRKWYGDKADQKQQGAGAIKVICSLWEEWAKQFEGHDRIIVEFIHPIKNATKLNAEEFKKLTNWHERCNQHARDAGVIAKLYNPAFSRVT